MVKKKEMHEEMNKFIGQVKENWHKLSEKAGEVAKKGEQGIMKASTIGKLEIEAMGLSLKKDKLIYEMGKKIYSAKSDAEIQDIIKQDVTGIKKIDTEIKAKNKKVNSINKKK